MDVVVVVWGVGGGYLNFYRESRDLLHLLAGGVAMRHRVAYSRFQVHNTEEECKTDIVVECLLFCFFIHTCIYNMVKF